MPPRRFRNLERTIVFDREVLIATRALSRLLGLALLDRADAGDGLLIPRCRSVHTFGMRFRLDLLFLDDDGAPIEARIAVSPGRIVRCSRAAAVLELPSNRYGVLGHLFLGASIEGPGKEPGEKSTRGGAIPRYVIERVYGSAVQEDMERLGARAKSVALEHFPDVTWEHSHIVSDGSEIKSFCVYEAPNEERLREHAARMGGHTITHMYEIAADVTPADFAV